MYLGGSQAATTAAHSQVCQVKWKRVRRLRPWDQFVAAWRHHRRRRLSIANKNERQLPCFQNFLQKFLQIKF